MNDDPRREWDPDEELIALAIRSMPLPSLPTDFATQVAAQVDEGRPRFTADLIVSLGLAFSLGTGGLVYLWVSLRPMPLADKPTLLLTLAAVFLVVQFWDSLVGFVGLRTSTDKAHAAKLNTRG